NRVVSYMGGRMPLSSQLSHYLRQKLSQSLLDNPREAELRFLKPLFKDQSSTSHIPSDGEFLIESIKNQYGNHLFFYPFEGRQVHEVMGALFAWRISALFPVSCSIAMNDYGFELSMDNDLTITEEHLPVILSKENLIEDLLSSINATEMAKRKFRDIAVISGLVIQNLPRRELKFKNIQSSSNLIFKVLEDLEPDNYLLKQAYSEVFNYQVEEFRLRQAFERISQSKIIFRISKRFSPLSFPIKVDSLRQSLSNEELEVRIKRMQKAGVSVK
ncbi:MAG: DNA ligase-associated DEXH box helicase, partial [Bacteroidota bacterium]